MGGAFVAVADDASAAFWNPAGFAAGSYLSLVLDVAGAELGNGVAAGEDSLLRASRSGGLIALGAPMFGLSYSRVRMTAVDFSTGSSADSRNPPMTDAIRLTNLVTHAAGATLVQSISQGLAVGATLKLVRGIAASTTRPARDPDSLLDEAEALVGQESTVFDADLGAMATFGRIKAGLAVRNVTEPEFEAAGDGGPVRLDRQVRTGIAVSPAPGWLLAVDLDVLRTTALAGSRRNLAFGTEGRVVRRAFVRGGLRFDTAADHDRSPTVSVGGSYAATAQLLIDAEVTTGSDRTARGWGISGRIVY